MAFLLHHFWPGGTEDQYRVGRALSHQAYSMGAAL
jgi:hypothetical protein